MKYERAIQLVKEIRELSEIADRTLEQELDYAIETGTFEKYVPRAEGESKLFQFGESCNWNREQVIEYCLQGVSGFLGRQTFERSFDNGKMREMSKAYNDALKKYKSLLTA